MRAAFDREATGQWEQILQMQERCDALSQSRNDDWMRFTPRTDAKWEASHGKLIKGMRERKKDWWERDEKTPRNNYASKVSRLNELAQCHHWLPSHSQMPDFPDPDPNLIQT